MNKNICVFCSSSDKVDKVYFQSAADLGRRIGKEQDSLVYGGGNVGLMGELARSANTNGAEVIGIIPQKIHDFGIGWEDAEEYIVTSDMRERKALLEEKADAFIALPGGFGTLEEILEVLTLKQLGYHNKPVVFLNTNHFYDTLMDYFEILYAQSFAKPGYRNLYYCAPDVNAVYDYLMRYKEEKIEAKWH